MEAFRIDRDVVRVVGPDAATYLQGQLSQDLDGLEVQRSVRALLLAPTGKTVAWLRVSRIAADAFVLDTDAGIGEAMVARLQRFLLRTDAVIEPLAWQCVAVRGPGADLAAFAGGAEVVADAAWPGVAGVDLLGGQVLVPAGIPEGTAARYEQLRVGAGVPVTGRDLLVDGIPNEGGRWLIDVSASFTKGCYTGQELLARVDSRGGNVPRPIRQLLLGDGPAPPAGAEVLAGDGVAVGTVTSVAGARALAIVGRAVDPGAGVTLRWDGGEVPATVQRLPVAAAS